MCDNTPTGRPPLSQPPKPLMAIRSSSGFSHLRPGVFHISLQARKTQHTQLRRWKKRRTNNHGLGFAPSARREKFVTLLCSFLCICEQSRACIRAKFPHSHQECWLTLVDPASGSTGPSSRLSLTAGFPQLLFTALSCWLLFSVYLLLCRLGPWLPSSSSSLVGDLCVGFAPKQTKGSSDWHSPTNNQPH